MIKTLVKHGDEWAVVIDEATLDSLEIGSDTPLEVVVDGGKLVIAPYVDVARAEKLAAIMEKTNRRFGPAFRKLAE